MKHKLLKRFFTLFTRPSFQYTLALLAAGLLGLLLYGYFLFPTSSVYAATLGRLEETCTSTKGTVRVDCEKQDPTVQLCSSDAQSRKILPAFSQGVLIGEVDLRYSPTCNSYWIRTMAYGSAVKSTSHGPVISVEANITFPDQTQDNADNPTPQLDRSLVTWTQMTPGVPPQSASGIYDLSNGQSITIMLS